MAGMDYALAATFPTLSTPDNPVLYYIRNTRADKFAVLNSTTANMGLVSDKSQACMFWFESAGDLINDTYQPVKIHNITTAMTFYNFTSWSTKGNTWYIRTNTENADFLGIGAAAGDEGNTSLWWNDYAAAGTTVGNWCLSGDGGSIWDITPVPDDELPAAIGTITWNLKKGNEVVASVVTAGIAGESYPAPFNLVKISGATSATATNGNVTVNVNYDGDDLPFTPSANAAEAVWYKAIMRGNKYLHYDNPEVSCNTGNASKNDLGSYFAFVGNPVEGFRIYNAALPKGKALGGNLGDRLTAVPEAEAPAFIFENNSGHFVFRNPENFVGYLNDNNNYLGYWITGAGATDGGSTWTFEPINEKQTAEIKSTMVIATAEDLKAFAELVNTKNPYACAILVADIDKGTENYRIGRDGQDFQGVFDGNGHTITYDMTFTEQGGGLFRNVGVHAIIQNLKVQGTINSNSKFAGSIAGWNSGRIRGCYADVTINSTVNGDATDGGLVGIAYRGTVIENCLVKVKILGENTTNCGGVVGWANDKINITNCLVVNDGSTFKYDDASNGHSCNIARNEGNLNVVNLDNYNANPYANRPAGANYNNYVTSNWGACNATTVVPFDELADGKICFQLNNDQRNINWVQTIGTDPFPVPAAFGNGVVYASGATDCKGTSAEAITYSNTATNAITTAHTFDKYGICTTCGCFNFGYFTEYDKTDASVILKSADDIFLAEGWNRVGDGFKLNMKMANDITITSEPGQLIFNNSNWVDGNFNGEGHVLTIEMADINVRGASFIPEHTGIFENVIMHGTISTSGDHAGSISGHGRQAIVRNVYSDVTINTTKTGDNTTGGFFGIGYNSKKVENSIYAGNINGVEGTQCIAGFCGWADASTNLTNCAFVGTLINAGGDSHTISRNNGNVKCENVFSLNEYNNSDAGKYTKTTPEAVANGELAFLLNNNVQGAENFYQLIGTDPTPMPIAKDGAKVYAKADSYTCDGKALGNIVYLNEEIIPDLPAHEFDEGICKNCGYFDTDEEGYLKIIGPKTLTTFAQKVNDGQTNLKARMYNDINMKGVAYTSAGNTGNLYVGEFDGQGHTISNLTVNGGDYTGLFGVIGGGADIKNFVLDKTCSINGTRFCGIIGGTNGGGNVYITNLGNEGNVTGTEQNVCGILGVDMSGAATLFITNCYATGAIKGGRESATVCGWSNGSSQIVNCWTTATLEGILNDGSFTRGSCNVVNCYEIESVGKQPNVNKITEEEVANGALCFKLNGAFGQVLGKDPHPVFATINGYNEVRYDDQYGFGYYNPLPLNIMDGAYKLAENTSEDKTDVKSADIAGTFLLTEKAEAFTENAVAFIMDAKEYAEKGINGKHLFGAVAKNGDFSIDADGRVAINFTSFSTNTDQPIFAGDLNRQDVGDVANDAMYVVAIYGGSLVADGVTEKATIIKSYTGSDLLATVVAEALAFNNADDATAINGVNNDNNDGAIYSITGVRVNKAQKGIYIINGKKVANK